MALRVAGRKRGLAVVLRRSHSHRERAAPERALALVVAPAAAAAQAGALPLAGVAAALQARAFAGCGSRRVLVRALEGLAAGEQAGGPTGGLAAGAGAREAAEARHEGRPLVAVRTCAYHRHLHVAHRRSRNNEHARDAIGRRATRRRCAAPEGGAEAPPAKSAQNHTHGKDTSGGAGWRPDLDGYPLALLARTLRPRQTPCKGPAGAGRSSRPSLRR